MASERSTGAGGCRQALEARPSRVALCAVDDQLADRIVHTLSVAEHEPARCSLDMLASLGGFHLLDAELIVAAVRPKLDAARLALLCPQLPEIPKIAVVREVGSSATARLLSAGIDGLVLEDELEQTLAPAIAAVLAGQVCVPADARALMAGPVFSHREKQVLRLLVTGLTNSEIAGRLYLSESTVKSHLSSSFRKLGVSSRAEVVDRARSSDSPLQLPSGAY